MFAICDLVISTCRHTPLSYGNRPGTCRKRKSKRTAGEHYTTATCRRAIHRACNLAFPAPEPPCRGVGESVESWQEQLTEKQQAELTQWHSDHRCSPNQLRRVQGLAYPTQASRSADVKTGEIAGKEPGVPNGLKTGIITGNQSFLTPGKGRQNTDHNPPPLSSGLICWQGRNLWIQSPEDSRAIRDRRHLRQIDTEEHEPKGSAQPRDGDEQLPRNALRRLRRSGLETTPRCD